MAKSQKKDRIPSDGYASGLRGTALCGRRADYRTGDHNLIRMQALANPEGVCERCLRLLRKQYR